MFIERIRLFFAKYRIIIYCFAGILICGGLYFVVHSYKEIYPNISETSKGVIGTLLGALVGGCFTLMGSLTLNKRAQKAINAIKRKNVIYKPLYDELMGIHNRNKDDFYPRFVYLGNENGLSPTGAQLSYKAWGRIKNDARYFEVPPKLKKAIERLYNTVNAYLDKWEIAELAYIRIYKETIRELTKKEITANIYLNSTLLSGVLFDNRPLYCGFPWPTDMSPTDKDENNLWNNLVRRAKTDTSLQSIIDAKTAWNKAEKDVLDLLGMYIQYIVVKYEG